MVYGITSSDNFQCVEPMLGGEKEHKWLQDKKKVGKGEFLFTSPCWQKSKQSTLIPGEIDIAE